MPSRPRSRILYCKWSMLILYAGGAYRRMEVTYKCVVSRHVRDHTCKNLTFSRGCLQVHYFISSFDLQIFLDMDIGKKYPVSSMWTTKLKGQAWNLEEMFQISWSTVLLLLLCKKRHYTWKKFSDIEAPVYTETTSKLMQDKQIVLLYHLAMLWDTDIANKAVNTSPSGRKSFVTFSVRQ